MKVFTRDYRITGDYHELWADCFGGLEPCVFDIETTGLDRSRCKVVLTGFLTRTDSGVRITQFLAENHYEESKVLEASMRFLAEHDIGCLITFNGCAFDVPFMNARLDAAGNYPHNILRSGSADRLYDASAGSFDGCDYRHALRLYNFDLYRFLKKCTDLRARLGSMSQMSIENYYGILSDRGDTITGRESVMLFDQYALSGSSTIEKIILTHNREDVLHLHRLMFLALRDIPDLHTALSIYGFPAAGGRLSVRTSIKSSSRRRSASPLSQQSRGMIQPGRDSRQQGQAAQRDTGGILTITGEQIKSPVSGAFFPDADCPVTAVFNSDSSSYEISVPVGRHCDDFYIDLSFIESLTDPLSENMHESSNSKKTSAALFRSQPDSECEDAPCEPGSPDPDHRGALCGLRQDPDCVNDFLILNPRTINRLSALLAEFYYRRSCRLTI